MKRMKCELKTCKLELASVVLITDVMCVERDIAARSSIRSSHGKARVFHILSLCP